MKFVVEPDDAATRTALEQCRNRFDFEIIESPDVGPRTKPKALNAALPFARGEYTVVFDAEDEPEPDQLRRALAAFAGGPPELACVQARLTIDNTNDSWLARMFTAEYAGQFDVYLPGLAALGLPILLGGSSNHFRTETLRACGAWDPYNVTEDADLGIRLARFGCSMTVIASSTYEEAPAKLGPWLKQRTRWLKGWLQTWGVHMRHPCRLFRDLGPGGFVTFQFGLAGTVFAALLQPFMALNITCSLLGVYPQVISSSASAALWHVHIAALIAGYAMSLVMCGVGLSRRAIPMRVSDLFLWLLYWPLLSIAAWRALLQLPFDRFRWEKTEHGLARTSRRVTGASSPT